MSYVVFKLSSEALLQSVRHSIVLGKNIHTAEFSQGTFSCHSTVLDKPTRISIMPDETNKIENSMLTLSTHREILKFLNDAVRAEDLVHGRQSTAHIHPAEGHAEHESKEKKKILERKVADSIVKLREERFPLGFTNIADLVQARVLDEQVLGGLIANLGRCARGEWEDFPVDIPRRGDGTRDGVVHAALLKNGKVLFITADETTLLWNPDDTTAATFEDPALMGAFII